MVTQVDIPCSSHDDGVLWCLIGQILFGVLYIPPSRSVNHDDEIFTKIQVDIVNIKEFYNVESVCLLGDFNGRTGSEPEFITFSEHVLNQLDDRVCSDLLVHNDCFGDSVTCICISRDTVINGQGKQVLNLCNSMNLRIMNGRFGP